MATAARFDATSTDQAEHQTRHDLAACYRLAAKFGMTDTIYTHISARIPGTEDILINRFGDQFHEVTASRLVRFPIHATPSAREVNPAGTVIHTAIHAARHDVGCVMHTHTVAGIAVACQADGLLPISQHALQFYNRIGYHDYEGIALLDEEKPRLVRDLGNHGALVLRNHGLLTAYATIAETFSAMINLERACQIQIAAMSGGARLYPVAEPVRELTASQCENFGGQDTGLPEWIALVRDLTRTDPDFAD
ncbi:class II aldolase/adducin family protein [Novosphingobium sp. FSW06-99]|uniref:class II aldolase/adducin family protein n=1 Tax=Novosphingobium sp. FSW06-99 TaxID=1739113 RepID=UPI00076CC916|nr:class II aldolase/adducin family protein [Novosphingobium sp. FSW06-99]KUR80192.1 aldolase [Novosphingobium sp. FSW06-99]